MIHLLRSVRSLVVLQRGVCALSTQRVSHFTVQDYTAFSRSITRTVFQHTIVKNIFLKLKEVKMLHFSTLSLLELWKLELE